MVLVDCDKVVEIFADHLRAEIRSDSTVEPDLSSYSDKLWRNAYERGRAVMKPKVNGELIRCKSCKWFYEGKWCVRYMYALLPEDFCSYAERKTNYEAD